MFALSDQSQLDKPELQRKLLRSETWIRRFVDKQLGVDLRRLISPDDVVQEIWIAAFQSRRTSGLQFQPDGADAFDRWLMGIAARKVIKIAKSARRLKRGGGREILDLPREQGLFSEAQQQPPATPSGEAAVQEAATAVRGVLTNLPQDRKNALQLRYLEGMSLEEISCRTGKSQPAVRSLIYQGLRQMRQELGSPGLFFSDAPTTNH